MDYYFDEEFNAVFSGKGFQQCLISIGIVAVEQDVVIDSFYSLIHPQKFQKLMKTVKKMTHLTDTDIRHAPPFQNVMDEVKQFLERTNKDDSSHIYTFGPDDLRTMREHAKYEQYKEELPFTQTIDLQKYISKTITWNQQLLSRTLSLDDLKYIHEIQGQVEHNALNDAYDLFYLHHAFLQQTQNIKRIQEVWNRIETKRQEVKQRSQERMIQILKERYGSLHEQKAEIHCYPDIIDQLHFLSQQDKKLNLNVTKEHLTLHDESFDFSKFNLFMRWDIGITPSIILTIGKKDQEISKTIPLTYRNARIFYEIWSMGHKDLSIKSNYPMNDCDSNQS